MEELIDAYARVLAERLDLMLNSLDKYDAAYVSDKTIRKVRPQRKPRIWNDAQPMNG